MIFVDLIRWEIDGQVLSETKPEVGISILPVISAGVIIDGALACVESVVVDDENGLVVAVISCKSVECPCEPSTSPAP